ncbi:MAG TPA: hypothetical protein VGM91_00990 [Conexibacter sp.]|jgi:hypothetical protein
MVAMKELAVTVETRRRRRVPWANARLASWAVPPSCALVGGIALARGDPDAVGDLGLISAIPLVVFACLGLLSASFVLVLRATPLRRSLLAAHVLVLLLLLHGAPSLLEQEPRFATAWLHAGFVDQIAQTGQTLPGLDARFNWPGFFAGAAVLLRGIGIDDPAQVLRWAPLLFVLLALAPVYLIASSFTRDARIPWLALWLFVPADWVGQDYFSPQALGFTLFLAFMVVLLRWFGPARQALAVRTRPSLAAESSSRASPTAPAQAGLIALLMLLYGAMVWSHQLTPYFAVAATTALVLLGACRMRTLPLLLAVIAIAFVSYLAVPYWSGHLGDIFGGVGKLGSTVSSNVADRVAVASGTYQWVPRTRILMTVAVWALTLLGAGMLWWHGRRVLPLLSLVVVPYSVLALQSYGGEVLLRAYIFALPFAAVLMGTALVRVVDVNVNVAAAVVLPLLTLVLCAGFYVARFGNEAFEMVRPGEVAALKQLYRSAPPGATFASLDSNVPWRFTGIERYDYATLPIGPRAPTGGYLERVRRLLAGNPDGGYLVITHGQIESARLVRGVPPRQVVELERRLDRDPGFTPVYRDRDARVYRFVDPAGVVHAR